jgi:hypothetical protein
MTAELGSFIKYCRNAMIVKQHPSLSKRRREHL